MSPMQQGLGGLDAGAMENPQFNAAGGGVIGYMGGGAVAFDKGGPTNKESPAKSWEQLYASADAQDDMSVEDFEKYMATLDPIQQKLALGKYAPSLKMKEADLTRRESAIAADAEQQKKLDEAAYYGDIGEYSAEQGSLYKKAPTFIDILARAQKGKAQRAQAAFEKQRTARDAIEQSKIAFAEAKEALQDGNFKLYQAKKAKAEELKNKATEEMAKSTTSRAETREEVALREAAEGRADVRRHTQRMEEESPENQLLREALATPKYLKDGKTLNPERQEKLDLYTNIKNRGFGYMDKADYTAALKRVETARKNAVSPDDPELVAALEDLAVIQASMRQGGGGQVQDPNAPPPGYKLNP
jgi:hypothetical protein